MAKRVSPSIEFPEDLLVVETTNCTTSGNTATAQDLKANARLVLKDNVAHGPALEYVVSFFPNFGWAWGE